MARLKRQRTYPYRPDYATPPGYVLEDYLETWGISTAEFAERHSLRAGLIEDFLTGAAPLDENVASILEQDFSLPAELWLKMEATYRRRKARIEAAKRAESLAPWAKSFPLRELVRRGVIEKPLSDGDRVLNLLDFFGVKSVADWQRRHDEEKAAYRHSPTFTSNEFNLAVWLRLGELEAQWQQCDTYDAENFHAALSKIRSLTRGPTGDALDQTFALCNQVRRRVGAG